MSLQAILRVLAVHLQGDGGRCFVIAHIRLIFHEYGHSRREGKRHKKSLGKISRGSDENSISTTTIYERRAFLLKKRTRRLQRAAIAVTEKAATTIQYMYDNTTLAAVNAPRAIIITNKSTNPKASIINIFPPFLRRYEKLPAFASREQKIIARSRPSSTGTSRYILRASP